MQRHYLAYVKTLSGKCTNLGIWIFQDLPSRDKNAGSQESESSSSKVGVGASATGTRSAADIGIHVGEKDIEDSIHSIRQEEENKGSKATLQHESLTAAPEENINTPHVPRITHRYSLTDIILKGWPSFQHSKDHETWWQTLGLAFQTLGVIYGDLGTSPLYVYPSINITNPSEQDYLGLLSIIIWTVTMVGIVKYVFLVLHADDHGEGGTFALYSLLCQHAQIGEHSGRRFSGLNSDLRLSHFSKHARMNSTTKQFLEKSKVARKFLLLIVMLGTCMLIGDGILTPSISVLSSIEGIELASSSISKSTVIVISIAILVAIFLTQRIGTAGVSFLFSPIMSVWLLTTALIGIFNIQHHYPGIFKACSPHYIIALFSKNGKQGWSMLGGTVLCVTGAEAMFADLGHFNKRSIQVAFSTFVYPSVILQYAGQSAYLIKHPDDHKNAFYKSLPKPVFWPMFVIATLAAIVASQGLISASFSTVRQSVSLHYFPRVKMVHTSQSTEGQIYSPEVNYILMLLCIAVTIGFQESSTIGNAFGVAVIFVMLITTVLMCLVMLIIWRTPIWLVTLFLVVFGLIEGVYMSAVVTKIPQGGWLPFAVSILLVIIMRSWKYGHDRRYEFEMKNLMSEEDLGALIATTGAKRVPGLCFFYSDMLLGVPPIVSHYVKNIRSLHQIIVLITIRYIPVKTVLPNERFLVGCLRFRGAYRCIAQYGYTDIIDTEGEEFTTSVVKTLKGYITAKMAYDAALPHELPHELEFSRESVQTFTSEDIEELEIAKVSGAIFVLGRTILRTTKDATWMGAIITSIYQFLVNNCRSVIDTWRIPYLNFLELGMRVDI
ncbi:hypothetical protein GOP47_0002664 [Adiantum capillus-veneris]|uniref:Potassium transporter n=1 Tax=Adiantum capillus-veneris TaxID=13818 RepID=A0A9D4VAI1_ADICA|nr:hypothetical protein GOP47_0002664 [Adiantum capillus-veneris]